jgi:uncharacterized membrane protein required for colicin V production
VTITLFDILFLFALLGGAALGFYRRLLRQATATLFLYVALVLAALAYRSVSRTLVRLTGQLPQATDVLGFFMVMGVMLALFFVGRHELISNLNDDRRSIWGNILGMVFGFLNAAIVCAIVVIVLRSATAGEPWPAYSAIQTLIRKGLGRSWMVYAFSPFTRLLLAAIEPLLFGQRLPPLLRNAL